MDTKTFAENFFDVSMTFTYVDHEGRNVTKVIHSLNDGYKKDPTTTTIAGSGDDAEGSTQSNEQHKDTENL